MFILKLAVIVISYLIGSISPAIMICKAKYGVDIRTLGSGNAGTTNVLRNYGKKLAGITLFLDAIKGIVCYFAGYLVFDSYEIGLACGLAAVIGHIFPIYYGFKGGKGVATTMGLCVVAVPKAAAVAVIAALIIMAVSRRISLGSLLGIVIFTVYTVVMGYSPFVIIWALIITVIIWIKHRGNIKRLLSGTEPKFSLKK
ncbi:MAG: glycerol-3-phosphate 1-O-acyltransferase PlsY [Bacillota bacterium]|nr:glycerol-3-phosphate 1-O-acyltransferase PlsY [Bacillota bacterium]